MKKTAPVYSTGASVKVYFQFPGWFPPFFVRLGIQYPPRAGWRESHKTLTVSDAAINDASSVMDCGFQTCTGGWNRRASSEPNMSGTEANSVGSDVECGLIDLLIKIELRQLDRPLGDKCSVDRVNGQFDRIDVRQIQSALRFV